MIRYCFFYMFNLFFSLSSIWGQEKIDKFSSVSNSCNIYLTSIDPTVFIIDTIVLKREEPKIIKRRLKLGIKGRCIYVVDSLGNVQPYKVKSFDFSMNWHGSNGPFPNIGSQIEGSCDSNLMSFFCKSSIGSKFFLDNVRVVDKNGKELKSIIEPLTVVKIK